MDEESGLGRGGQRTRKPLVTVQYETEVDVATGKREKRMFVKMFFDAVDDGLLRELSPRLWRGLCCVARYVDEDGVARVSQERIAEDLGISRQHANKLLGDLCAFRRPSTGEAVISQLEQGGIGGQGKKFRSNVYQLHPVAGFQFGKGPLSPKGDRENRPSVSRNGDRETEVPCHPLEPVPCHLGGDTYKRESIQDTHTERVCVEGQGSRKETAEKLVSEFHVAFGRTGRRKPARRELEAVYELLDEHGEVACRHLVKFARVQAEKTRFLPRYFQGIVGYLPDALVDLERVAAARTRRTQVEREREAAERVEAEKWQAMSAEERAQAKFETKLKVAELTRKRLSVEDKARLREELLAAERRSDKRRAETGSRRAAM